MEILDLKGSTEFSPERHVYTTLAETPFCSISVVGWEPGQTSSIHSHPTVDEIYHVLEGEGLFDDGRKEVRAGRRRPASGFPRRLAGAHALQLKEACCAPRT